MNRHTAEELFDAKRERRMRLAKLTIDEKIDLIEKLQQLGRSLVDARSSLPANAPGKQRE